MKRIVLLAAVLANLAVSLPAAAGIILMDTFGSSSLNSASPTAPSANATAYHLFSSKNWSPSPLINSNVLSFGIAPSTSGHIEVQALFATTPVALTNAGDHIELTVTFTNTSGLLAYTGHVGFGIYNSGGVSPIAGGMNATAVSGTAGVTGGAQGWQGYVSQIAYSSGTHRIATRPAQAITTANNQDLITDGSSSQSYVGDVQLAGAASAFNQTAGTQLTEALRYTLIAPGTLQIDSRLHLGANTNGTLLMSQSAFASGADFLTNSFDALCVGWRATSTAGPTLIDIKSIAVTAFHTADVPDDDVTTNVVTRAFPGAEGAGAFASGGRGGDVYYVTTLADTGAGSLRNGISGAPAGGRTICFKVSGNIALNSTLTINKPNITVAGQTAPGDGICIQDQSFNIAANNVIVRHMRTRLGTNKLAEADGMWINSGTNIIVDHVSASWSVDETLSASRNIANLTVQNCFITESLNNSIHVKGAHGYGGIISSSFDSTYTYLRNLYAHNNSRNPRVGSDSQDGVLRLDFRNNVIFNYGGRAGYTGGATESVEINYVGNYCIKGPSSSYNYILEGGAASTAVHQSGNYIDLNRNGLVDGANTGWSMFSGSYTAYASPFDVPVVATDTAPVAYQKVVALSGAMPWRRDANDQRIARTVRTQQGSLVDFVGSPAQPADYITNGTLIGVRGWPTLMAETPPNDADNDGMADFWELAMQLNPNAASDRNETNAVTGYTRLEEYLNWLADAHALCDRGGKVLVDLRAVTGNSTNLSYSILSSVNGTATLLQDGYTARFTALPGTNGLAGFTFGARDGAAGVSFGEIPCGILITTTNAPAITRPVLHVSGYPPVLTVEGDSGFDYTVQVSTNLLQWFSVWTTNAAIPPFTWTDVNAPNLTNRFYRVILEH